MLTSFPEILVILSIVAFATKAAAYFAAEGGHLTLSERRTVAFKSVAIQAIVLSIFVAFGPNILHFFHVSISALEVAGGLILLLFAIGLVLGESHDSAQDSHRVGPEMAVYPIAMPLLASPQAIVAITIFSTQMGQGGRQMLWAGLGTVLAANLAVMLIVAQLIGGEKKGGGSGASGVLLRIVALLLAALAVEIIALGLRGYGILPPMPAAH